MINFQSSKKKGEMNDNDKEKSDKGKKKAAKDQDLPRPNVPGTEKLHKLAGR